MNPCSNSLICCITGTDKVLVQLWGSWGWRQLWERELLWARQNTTDSVWYKAACVQYWVRRIRILREDILGFRPFPYSHVGSEWETWFPPSYQNIQSILRIMGLKLDFSFNSIQADKYIFNIYYLLTSIQESHKQKRKGKQKDYCVPY